MAGAIDYRDAEYVAITKANLIAEAEQFLRQRYVSITIYGAFAILLLLGAVFAAYKVYQSVFRYRTDLKSASLYSADGDNVNDPGDDDEPYVPVWESEGLNRRVPSGNQIRNRIAQYSKMAGRDLRADLDSGNDDYDDPRPARSDDGATTIDPVTAAGRRP